MKKKYLRGYIIFFFVQTQQKKKIMRDLNAHEGLNKLQYNRKVKRQSNAKNE